MAKKHIIPDPSAPGGIIVEWTGTEVTGTSKKAQTVDVGGHADQGDYFVNTSTAARYVCVKSGKEDAEWVYQLTGIAKKPTVPVKSLSLTRRKGNRIMDATWKLQKEMTAKTRSDRAQGLYVDWELDIDGGGDIADKETKKSTVTSDSENLASFTANGGGKSKSYTRASFYPHTKAKLTKVTVTVNPYNSKGRGGGRVPQSKSFKFARPDAPTMTAAAFDTSNGKVSVTVKSDAGEGGKERVWTHWKRTVTNTASGGNPTVTEGHNAGTSFTLSYDVGSYQALKPDQYIKVEFEAWNQGFAGDSGHVRKTYYVSYPKAVSVAPKGSAITVTSTDASGKVIVPIKVNRPEGFPVDYVKLQQLVNVTYAKPEDIPGDASWADVGITDNGNCSALMGSVADMLPDEGKHTFVRVKAWHASEAVLFSYSNVVEVKGLFRKAATAADNACAITKLTAGEDGTSLTAVVAWDKTSSSSDDDTTSMQLSWSDYANAWKSNKAPETYEFDWHDSTVDPSASSTWSKSAAVDIRGLKEGTLYHLRARCVTVDSSGNVTYGEWCNVKSKMTASTPPSVVLSAPTGVASGEGIPFTWVLSSLTAQAEWQLFKDSYRVTPDTAVKTGKTYYTLSSGAYTPVTSPSGNPHNLGYYERLISVIAGEKNALGAFVLGAERAADFTVDGELTCAVRCSTGGEFVESKPVSVIVSEYPDLILDADELTAQPFAFTAETGVQGASLAYTVAAAGAGVAGVPETGRDDQPAGDVVDTAAILPEWEAVTWANSLDAAVKAQAVTDATAILAEAQAALDELEPGDDGYDEAVQAVADATAALAEATAIYDAGGSTRYQATVTLLAGLPFYDGGTYAVSASVTDQASGLSSAEAVAEFGVAWSHQAPAPATETWALTADESVDPSKTYYTRSGAGTEDDPYEYGPVASPVAADLGTYYEYTAGITITPSVTTDDDGHVTRSCEISLVAPSTAVASDSYDIYRVTHDGAARIGTGLALTGTWTDEFATFGDAGDYAYRIACRTADGDEEWADFGYYLEGNVLRFDFGKTGLELPYDIAMRDKYAKDVEVRTHLDGVSEAYYGAGVTRSAKLSTNVIRIEDAEKAALVRELGQHRGTAFVRTPDGSAYEADVQVESMDVDYNIIAAGFTAVEVALSDAHRLPRTEG